MKKLITLLLLWSSLASAQIGNFPALIGQRGTTTPSICSIGQLFFKTNATAGQNIYGCTAANTWTVEGGGSTVAFPVTVTGGTSGGIPYFSATTTMSSSALLGATQVVTGGGAGNPPVTSALFTYTDTLSLAGPGVKIGTSGTSVGLVLGYAGSTGSAGVWNSALTQSTSNYIIRQDNGGTSYINGASGTAILFSISDAEQFRITSTGLQMGGKLTLGRTAPSIASGFGSSPSIVASNGTAAFTVNVGTGGSASSGVITMPAASTGWACVVTPNAAPQAAAVTYSAPTSTTSITLTNYTLTSAATLAWTASSILQVLCHGY